MENQQAEEWSWPQPKPPRDNREKKPAIDLDMNPMVDLAFLLLTFFMLATTFSKPQVMELVMPILPDKEDEEQVQPVKESQALTIILGENDEVFWFQGITEPEINRAAFSPELSGQFLQDFSRQVQDPVILIKPEENSRYEILIDLLDEIHKVGIERYAITDLTETDRKILASEMKP